MATKEELYKIFENAKIREGQLYYVITNSCGDFKEEAIISYPLLKDMSTEILLGIKEDLFRQLRIKILQSYYNKLEPQEEYLICPHFIEGKYLVHPETYLKIKKET